MSEAEVIKDYLAKHTIGEVASSSPHKNMISVKPTDTVEDTLDLFRKHNILSAPVLKDEKDKDTDKDKDVPFLGIVNILDLLFATVFQSLFDKLDTDEKIASAKDEDLDAALDIKKKSVFSSPVKDVLGTSDESKVLRIFDSKDPLAKLMDAFGAGVHRVLVRLKDKDGTNYTYISQTDVVRSLTKIASTSEQLKAGILSKTVSELKMTASKGSDIVSVSSTARTLTGFRKMLQKKQLSALPVTDSTTGGLVNTLSASDFRGVRQDSLRLLLLTVPEFLKLSRAKPRQTIQSHKNVVCSPDEKFSTVMERIVTSGVHRLWIVGTNDVPLGVISLTDVIRQFAVQKEKSTSS